MQSLKAVSILVLVVFTASCGKSVVDPGTTLITNAIVYDGSGDDPYRGSVRVDGDRIVAIGDIEAMAVEKTIDASGLALAPGFIDTHSHHDEQLDQYRNMPAVLSQGITTIVRGMDGFAADSDPLLFQSLAEFNQQLQERPVAVNIASYSAHNTIRRHVMAGDESRAASEDEIRRMANLLETDMNAGALGLATGLEYEPGIYATSEEVIELAKVAAHYGGRYSSHIRDEDDRQTEAIDELIRIGHEARIPVHVSHIKLADKEFWGTSDALLQRLNNARERGIEVTADIYPYQRWASDLAVLFPQRDYSDAKVADFTFEHTASPNDIIISHYGPDPKFNGLSVAEIATITERDPSATLLDLAQAAHDFEIETGRQGSAIIAKGMDEGDVAALMQWKFTNICSDGGHGGGHPRGYGAFPRVLGRFVRDLNVLTLQQAIHKMTAMSAASSGIQQRGRIAVGAYADLVLFDPAVIEDRATMQDSTALSIGINKVWVNGILAFDDGAPTGSFAGRALRRDEL